jgi:hypothetical protein
MSFREWLNKTADMVESRWSLAGHIWTAGTFLVAAGLPAWAVWATGLFAQYAPLSWIAAGFVGLILFAIYRLISSLAFRIRVMAKFNERALEHGGRFNPMERTFENQRIYLADLVLPSHPLVEGKTFVDCDIIGPGNVYWFDGNSAYPIRAPIIDAILLDPDAKFTNGFIFKNCLFRNCSFQRITVFGGAENYPDWKLNPNLNIISVPPTPEAIKRRQEVVQPKPAAPDAPSKDEHSKAETKQQTLDKAAEDATMTANTVIQESR